MNLRCYDPRIIAIDLRHRRFGYAVYEGHGKLLDWGVRVYRSTGAQELMLLEKRLESLLHLFSPSVLVVKRERWELAQTSQQIRNLIESTAMVAEANSVKVRLIAEADVRSSFRNFGANSREQIAEALARIFPELLLSVPPKRRTWEAEHPRMTVFDAISLGLAYWHHPSTPLPPPWASEPLLNA